MTGTPTDAPSECGHPASELLDFHVNGSLEDDEAATVAAHVAACEICARDVRELRSLSESIAAHGVAPAAAWSRGGLAGRGLVAAAAVLVAASIALYLLRPGTTGTPIASSVPARDAASAGAPPAGEAPPGTPSPGARPAGVEVTLDLGAGTLRDAGSPLPHLDRAEGLSAVRLTFAPPVVPGTDLLVGVRGPAGEETVADRPLPRRDAMGRVALEVPATRLAAAGTYQVVLRPASPDAGVGPFAYPFEVRVAPAAR